MSKSELHDWECEIEELSGNNVDKMLEIAQDIYNTAFVRGRNHMTWEQPKWIPVSEKLPEQAGEYLVTYHPCYWGQVREDIYVGLDSFRGKTTWAKNKYQKVIAWQPLPEPYKKEVE